MALQYPQINNSGFSGYGTGGNALPSYTGSPIMSSAYSGKYGPAPSGYGRLPTGGTYQMPGQQQTPQADPLTNQYKLYNSAVEQQAGDYGNIMKNYQDLYAKAAAMPQLQTPGGYTPQTAQYQQSGDLTSAIANLKGLSESGGYSPTDINNLRERGISPIRSVYANAEREINRTKSLQGGYSPNYNATRAKMAREMSDQIANQTTNVNAGLAERIAQNKLQVAPQYAGVTGQQSDLANQFGARNADTMNQAQQFNMELPLKYGQYNQGTLDEAMKALQGMTGLYGTTPAMSSLFGNQALQGAQLQNNINNQGQQATNQFTRAILG